MDITLTIGADAAAKQIVEKNLKAYNVQRIGPYDYQPFELYARAGGGVGGTDGREEVVAGMFGRSGMDWLYIDYFWIDGSRRGAGLGSAMLAEAEAEARRRACLGVYLYTYSFQALDFYRKNGFSVMGVLQDCPVGHSMTYLSKRF